MPMGIYIHKAHSKATRKKMSDAHKGKKFSIEHRRSISDVRKEKKLLFGYINSPETRLKMSESRKGKIPWNKGGVFSKEAKKNMSNAHQGKKLSEATRRKLSEIQKGDKSHFWKGGITSENQKIRSSIEMKLWRESVFKHDDWRCLDCGERGGKLNADHIYPFAFFPRLRLDVNNGRTLCVECHKKTATFMNRWWKQGKTKEEIEDIFKNHSSGKRSLNEPKTLRQRIWG